MISFNIFISRNWFYNLNIYHAYIFDNLSVFVIFLYKMCDKKLVRGALSNKDCM